MMQQQQVPDHVRWIGAERADALSIQTAYFRLRFHLNAVPRAALLHISANTRFILYVNGDEVLRGPCRGDEWHHFCDAIDLAPWLQTGENILAASVTAYPPIDTVKEDYSNFGPIWAMSPNTGPLLIAWGRAGSEDLSTGQADWQVASDTALGWRIARDAIWMGCTEEVNGAKLLHGWQSGRELQDCFRPALMRRDNTVRFGERPRLLLHERPIPHLLRQDIPELSVLTHSPGFVFPADGGCVTLAAHGVHEAVFATPELTTAFVHLRCIGGAGSSVQLQYAEAFSKRDTEGKLYKEVRSDVSGELIGMEDIYHPGGGDESYSPAWMRTFRFIKIRVCTKDKPLTLQPLRLVETRYPLEPSLHFDSEAAWLHPVWKLSLRTLQLCMHETYEDCPYYEQLQYTMDTRLQMLYTCAISSDTRLPLKTIHDFHSSLLPEGILQSRYPSKSPQVIPVFALHWVFMLQDMYVETGDIGLLAYYRPTMDSILAWFRRKIGPVGLVEHLGYWDFADWTDAWADIHGRPRASLNGPSTIQNLVYCLALETAEAICESMGDASRAADYSSERAALLNRVNALCWAADRGMYREGPDVEEYSQHAQVWAVLNGLVNGDAAKAVMERTLTDPSLVPCSFAMQYYLFRALEKAGLYERTADLWRLWTDLLAMDLTTIPEVPGKHARSDCHAWGALLLHELPRKFLGVHPLAPGYASIGIQPMGLYLKRCSGSVPTPKGAVEVSWAHANGRFIIKGFTPAPAMVTLPTGARHDIEAGSFAFDVAYAEGG